MSFLYPTFLVALSAISIPIIIHLFNFRKYKKVYFTNVRFLREVKEQTQSKSKLKHLLILLARILAIVFLVLAFAQPYIAENQPIVQGKKSVSVYIDNSFSMNGTNENGRLLDQAKKIAYQIAESFESTDEFQLITNDFESKHNRYSGVEEFVDYIDEVETSAELRQLSTVVKRQQEGLLNETSSSKLLFVISDFQESLCDISSIENDSNIIMRFIPVQSETVNNISIDSCWFESPKRLINQPERLSIRISNTSNQDYENVPVKLTINNVQKSIASFDIPAQRHLDTVLHFTNTSAGFQNGEINIVDYPVTFDDNLFFSYMVDSTTNVLVINKKDSSSAFHALFSKDKYINLVQWNVKSIDYASLEKYQFIVLNELEEISSGLTQELIKLTQKGVTITVFPSDKIKVDSYNNFYSAFRANTIERFDTISTNVSELTMTDELFSGVFEKVDNNMDLPSVKGRYSYTNFTQSLEQVVMKTTGNRSFLSKYNYANATLYVFSSPLNIQYGNFQNHAVFVPILYRMALTSAKSDMLYYTISQNQGIELGHLSSVSDNVYSIVSEKDSSRIIPEMRTMNTGVNLFTYNQIRNAGNYTIANSGRVLKTIAFNYNRRESVLKSYTKDEIQSMIERHGLYQASIIEADNTALSRKINQTVEGIKLWKWCVLMTILFFIIETLFIRFWKT